MQEQSNQYRKLNSFSRRPCVTQIISYILILAINIVFWALIQDKFLNQQRRFALIVLFAMSLVVLLVVGFITSYLDPSDPILKQQSASKSPMDLKLSFDKYLYCQHCRSYVCVTSRHCKQCDRYLSPKARCITKFDHHCIWINSCIGSVNYKPFFIMICSAFAHLFLFLVALGMLSIEDNWQMYLSQIIVSWILGIIVAVFTVLLIGLITLHIFLIHNNLTTFDYILSKKTHQERKKFDNILRVKIEENKETGEHRYQPKTGNPNQNFKTQNQMPPPSAFQQISNNMEEDKSEMPSFESLKEKKQHKSPQLNILQNFEEILVEKTKQPKQDQPITGVLTKIRSLKVLVGDSLHIKSRRESLHQYSPKMRQRRNSTLKGNAFKVDDLIYYTREEQKLRRTQQA